VLPRIDEKREEGHVEDDRLRVEQGDHEGLDQQGGRAGIG
jgi:hypothetical protein